MLTRPWPILFLALAHILAPIFNAVFSSLVSDASLHQFVHWQWENSSLLRFFSLYLLFPIGGFFIYQCKKWSYYCYFATMLFAIWLNYNEWKETPFLYDPLYVMGFFSINTLLLGYFLVPSVRKIYMTERLRWWETDARYLVEMEGKLASQDHKDDIEVTVRNLSLGGALIDVDQELITGNSVTLTFEHEGRSVRLPAEVRNRRGFNYGITFEHDSNSFNELTRFIKNELAPRAMHRDETIPLLENFLLWANHLIRTGEGVFPSAAVVAASTPKRKKLKKRTASRVKEKRKNTKKL